MTVRAIREALLHEVVTAVVQFVLTSFLGIAFIIIAHDPDLFHMMKQKKKDIFFPLKATTCSLHKSDLLTSRWPDFTVWKAGKVGLL